MTKGGYSGPQTLMWKLTKVCRNPAEYAALEDLYSPIIHRVNQAVRARAVAQDGKIAAVPEILKKYSEPPEMLIKQARPQIDTLKKVASLKKGMILKCATVEETHTDTLLQCPPKHRASTREARQNLKVVVLWKLLLTPWKCSELGKRRWLD